MALGQGALSLPVGTRCENTRRTFFERCDNRCREYTQLAANAHLNFVVRSLTKVLVGENLKEKLRLNQQRYQTAKESSLSTLNGSMKITEC